MTQPSAQELRRSLFVLHLQVEEPLRRKLITILTLDPSYTVVEQTIVMDKDGTRMPYMQDWLENECLNR